MRILHVAPVGFKRISGPSNSVFGLAKGQVKLGHDVALLSSIPNETINNALKDGVILLTSPKVRQINPWKLSSEWINYIKEEFGEPDIINFHDTYIPFQTALAQLFIKENWPYIFTPRGGLMLLAQKVKAYKKIPANFLFFDEFVKNATFINALGKKEADDVSKRYPKSKILIVSNGIDEELFATFNKMKIKAKNTKVQQKELVIGFIGRIDVYHKGIDTLLKAIRILQTKQLGKYIKLVLIGPYHSKKDKKIVENMLKKMPFKKNIIIKGPASGVEKWHLMNGFDIFIHTSRFEGIPNSVLEAMAFGKPCLVTNGTNMAEVIVANKCGWGCEGSVEAVTETITDIYNLKKWEVLQQGKNANKYIISNHLMKDISKKAIDAYKFILSDYSGNSFSDKV